ncbi:MAG: hypothetical protein EWM72_02413 [Nitrospira sp.]|nr:MAG: hypothetical protein EWM72_02413 [Nitrospira sp.]
MTDDPGPLLYRALTLQEEVLKRNVAEYKVRYDFISECIDVVGTPGTPEQSWQTLPVSQRNVFNLFHGDTLSTLINAIRLGFQGCETDAYAIMRVVLENLTILQYIVQFGLYDGAQAEIEGNAKREKRFSNKFTYKTALNKLGIKDRRERLKGDLSNFGNHVSPSRLRMSRFEIGDRNYGKVGVSINNPRTKIVIGELASLCLFFVKITDDFLAACKVENGGAFHQKRVELESRYEDLKDK